MFAISARLTQLTNRLRQDSKAVTALEYGMIAALISLIIIGSITTIGAKLGVAFASLAAAI